MADGTERTKTTRQRVDAGLMNKQRAARMRDSAGTLMNRDRIGAVGLKADADRLDREADGALDRWRYTMGSPEITPGNELVPPLNQADLDASESIRDVARQSVDMLAHSASEQRMELALKNDSLSMSLEMAREMKARTANEKALAHQDATTHKLAMEFMANAGTQLQRTKQVGISFQAFQIYSVEAARMTNAATRLMAAFNEALLTDARRRKGGKQSMSVKHVHQQVQVNDGGQAIVAGSVKGGRGANGGSKGATK